jgi:phosphatidylglycerophosphatase A
MADPVVFLATWFGAGRLKPASGTIGTLAALPFAYAVSWAGGIPAMLVACIILIWVGTVAADKYCKASGSKDDQAIVIDEVAGLFIAAIPAGTNILLLAVAFVLFRIMDIYKPWPASFYDRREKGSAGFNVMMDDVIAGIYAFFGTATVAYAAIQQGL